jgi:hypothetical protein
VTLAVMLVILSVALLVGLRSVPTGALWRPSDAERAAR